MTADTTSALEILRQRGVTEPVKLGMILGTGLADVVDFGDEAVTIPYAELPGFPRTGVSGHAGTLTIGNWEGARIALFAGRAHYYEAGDAAAMRVPLETLKALGGESVILTNSAGSLNLDCRIGTLVAIRDHINLTGRNPLIGETDDRRFVDLTETYDGRLRMRLRNAAIAAGADAPQEGVYMWFSGPSFETAAEVKMAKILGADLVGMSTVPEAILARYLDLRVLAHLGRHQFRHRTRCRGAVAQREQERRTVEFGHARAHPARTTSATMSAPMPEPRTNLGLPQEIIRHKRDGIRLPNGDITAFVAGVVDGRVSREQTAAFLMAAFLRGLDRDETVALTRAMTASGTTLHWPDLPGPVLDKHSTGGVGDTVSLMLAPMVAACGGFVPMISGRGLGHTGGTLDKLESIPGYDVRPAPDRLAAVVREVGCAIVGQTDDLAPADRTLYAVRDVTATVESVPLITASILSKKLAAGLSGLVMDVKTGSGAFMASLVGARDLAQSLVHVAGGAGLPTRALITDMDAPLAPAAGNALEVAEAIRYLTGKQRDARLHAVVIALGAEMLLLGGLAADHDAAVARLAASLDSGAAAACFARMVAALGGPSDLLERYAEPAAASASDPPRHG